MVVSTATLLLLQNMHLLRLIILLHKLKMKVHKVAITQILIINTYIKPNIVYACLRHSVRIILELLVKKKKT